jgi:uncharacterized membrane protein YphA (DoxX/SURF4 family)
MAFSNRKLQIAVLAMRVALGAAFVYAGWLKLKEPWELFALAISGYQLLPLKAVELVARTLPWFEVLIGVMLIAGVWLRVAATITSAVLLGFMVLMVRAYAKGMAIDCGCFGNGDPISWKTLVRDGTMLAASLVVTWMAFWRARQRKLV